MRIGMDGTQVKNMSQLRGVRIANFLLGKPRETEVIDTNRCVMRCDVAYFSLDSGEISSSAKIKEFVD
jgi:hypothetical protein